MHYPGCTRAHKHGAAGTKVRRNPYSLPKAKRAYANLQRANAAMARNLAALKRVGQSPDGAARTKAIQRLINENIAIDKRLRKYNNDYQNYRGEPIGNY